MPKAASSPPGAPAPAPPERRVLTKADLAQSVQAGVEGLGRKQSVELVDLVFETMKETLGRGEKIKISGFGNFALRDKEARQGRNPQTWQPMKIDARRVLTFRPSQLLRDDLNARHEPSERTRS